jgi:hypothetical protein
MIALLLKIEDIASLGFIQGSSKTFLQTSCCMPGEGDGDNLVATRNIDNDRVSVCDDIRLPAHKVTKFHHAIPRFFLIEVGTYRERVTKIVTFVNALCDQFQSMIFKRSSGFASSERALNKGPPQRAMPHVPLS